MNDLELEKWLTTEGDKLVRKAAATKGGVSAMEPRERLIHAIWVLDTEQRNGGVSQYFCNRGRVQWNALWEMASSALTSFVAFGTTVNQALGRSQDGYNAIMKSSDDLDAIYEQHRARIIAELATGKA